jgi:predicted aspartyl protease
MSVRGRPGPSVAAPLLVLVAGCSADGVVPSTVPMDGAFRVDATIVGQPVRVWLDTGTTRTIVARAAVDRLGLPLQPAPRVTVVDATHVENTADGLVRVERLTIGANTWQPFAAPCLALGEHLLEDAMVGMDVLASAAWCFDAAAKVVHLRGGDNAEQDVAARGYRVLARTSLGGDRWRPMVTVRLVDRLDVQLLLDTGAAVTSLPEDVVARLALPPGDDLASQRAAVASAAATAQLRQQGIEGTVTVSPGESAAVGAHGVRQPRPLHHLGALELAGHRVTDLLVTASGHEGVLGRDVLATVPFLLHGPRGELWVLQAK